MSDKKRYLLECEIVGGEIASRGGNFVIVSPSRIYPKLEWIGVKKDFGILLEATSNALCAKVSLGVSFLQLDDRRTVSFKVGKGNKKCLDDLMNRSYSRVVLVLEEHGQSKAAPLNGDDLTVVGFKAQF